VAERTSKPLSDDDIIRESERLLGLGLSEPPPAPTLEYAGADPELTEEREHELARALAREQNEQSSASERARDLEIEQLKTEQARLQQVVNQLLTDTKDKEEAEYNRTKEGKERLRVARYRRIRSNGGFCTVQLATADNPDQNWPVELSKNDVWVSMPRGVPVRIPVEHLECLDHAEVDAWVKKIDDESGQPVNVRVQIERFNHVLLDETGLYPGAVEALRGHVL
jgi:hypothetical protein